MEGTALALEALRVAQRPGDRLEGGLEHMVRVLAVAQGDVQRHSRGGDEGAPELLGELRVERRRAEPRRVRREVDLVAEVRPPRDVERRLDERLVERDRDRGEAADARLVAERLQQGLAERDPGVLDSVVGVDLEVARRPDDEVEPGVRAELAEHVVEKGSPVVTSTRPLPSRSTSTRISLSPVLRCRVARRPGAVTGGTSVAATATASRFPGLCWRFTRLS